MLLVPNNPPPVEVPAVLLLAVDPNALPPAPPPPPKVEVAPPPNAPKPVAGFGAPPNSDPDALAVPVVLLAFENAPKTDTSQNAIWRLEKQQYAPNPPVVPVDVLGAPKLPNIGFAAGCCCCWLF